MNRLKNSEYNIPYLDIDCLEHYSKEAISKVSKEFSLSNNVLPIELNDNILTVFMGRPEEDIYNRLEKATGLVIRVFKTCPIKLNKKIQQINKVGIEEYIENHNYIG